MNLSITVSMPGHAYGCWWYPHRYWRLTQCIYLLCFFGIWINFSCRITRNIRLIQAYNSDFSQTCLIENPLQRSLAILQNHAPKNNPHPLFILVDPKKSKKETDTLLKTNSSPVKLVVSKFGISKLPGCPYFQVQAVRFRDGNFPTFPTCHLQHHHCSHHPPITAGHSWGMEAERCWGWVAENPWVFTGVVGPLTP